MSVERSSRGVMIVYELSSRRETGELVNALKEHHAESLEHSKRVGALCFDIGGMLQLGPMERRVLAMAGLLHDIGKIEVPLSILNKPATLDDAELYIARTHPRRGAQMLRDRAPREVIEAVGGHHEFQVHVNGRFLGERREEGRGSGVERRVYSPLGARNAQIVAVADTYDAIRSSRAYSPGTKPRRALELTSAGYTGERKYYEALKEIVWKGK